jgi:tRNA threonylcarbamoyladenosine biosynthesis protein TsaE
MRACFDLPDEQATRVFSGVLASCMTYPLLLTFQGDLGAGKTTLIRAMLRALGVTGAIKSPTFSLVETYSFSEYTLHHFDLYRFSDETELEALGFRDYLLPDTVCCIEWPTRAPSLTPYVDVTFTLELQGAGRKLTVEGLSHSGREVLSCLRKTYGRTDV